MPLSEFRTAYSWQEAIDLGPSLVRLVEELPGSEQMGLCWQLQQATVDLPAAIALDLMEDGSNTRRPVALKLIAALELIEKIYPALDTADVRAEVESVIQRISSDHFAETAASNVHTAPPPELTPRPNVAPPPTSAPVPGSAPAASIPVIPELESPATSMPEPAAPVAPLPSEPPQDPVSVQLAVPPTDEPLAQENHVQPDSV
ncbi:MAG TPA: hypothetical protein VMS08_01285 [Candidatus Saccharimonadia bacterium]|nr:hypothetical protein [Candidatus Saccharimonadia bacterium]